MPSYETLCILHPELPDARVKELSAWMQKILEGANGTAVVVDVWGMRDLTYLISKQRRGYYVQLTYDSPPAALKELERNLRINEHVLRYFSTVQTIAPTPPVATPPVATPPVAAPVAPAAPSAPVPPAAPVNEEAAPQ